MRVPSWAIWPHANPHLDSCLSLTSVANTIKCFYKTSSVCWPHRCVNRFPANLPSTLPVIFLPSPEPCPLGKVISVPSVIVLYANHSSTLISGFHSPNMQNPLCNLVFVTAVPVSWNKNHTVIVRSLWIRQPTTKKEKLFGLLYIFAASISYASTTADVIMLHFTSQLYNSGSAVMTLQSFLPGEFPLMEFELL